MEGYILGVYAGAVRVGTLGYDQPQDAFQFDYDAAWLALPSRENLLPEGEALVVAANDARVARNNVFGLLRHLGHETAGALGFVAAGQVRAEQEPLRRHLPFDELQARIDNRTHLVFRQPHRAHPDAAV